MHGHHHSPFLFLVKLGPKWMIAGAILFVVTSPVTLGIALAIWDHIK